MLDFELLKSVEVDNDVVECKGLYWRASVSSFISSYNSIETRKSLRLLKRKSCPGCEHCAWVLEWFNEEIYCDTQSDYLGNLKHGKIYTFKVISYQDYYDIYPEVEIEIVEVKE